MQRLDVNLEFTCIWIEMDIDYIKTRNLWLDINLILKTVGVLFGDDNAL